MYRFDKIKLIIWDLDDTFWNGTLSEGEIFIPKENVELIKNLTDIGIVNSICSKNDNAFVQKKLKEIGLYDYFVFTSVNWEPKGNRVKKAIKEMGLREVNVLFLDDNHSNREEVKYYCPEIMLGSPDDIPSLIEDVSKVEKRDLTHKRLKQYHILEEKRKEESQFNSNEEFLMSSNIRVNIHDDCLYQIDRIHDLILRANQLNFTKIRSSKNEIENIIKDYNIQTGYVTVTDKFGDYGIVGFYAIKNNCLIHFVFSCRTLGMGIEQYVYNYLNRPELKIKGEVISDLSAKELPQWINQSSFEKSKSEKMEIKNLKKHSVLIKGPCDLYQIYPYIANTELFDTEFTHVSDEGVLIDSTGHTTLIVESQRLSKERKRFLADETPFIDIELFNDNIFKKDYRVVIVSILDDANLGVYKRKETGELLAFLEYVHPITDPDNWEKIISGEYHNAGFKFTKEMLKNFSEKYKYIGRNTPEQIVDNLSFIRKNLSPNCKLVIMLGGELYYQKNEFEAYNDRHLVHKSINAAIRKWAKVQNNVNLIDVNKYLVDQSSFYDHFNHYIKPVYYSLAKEIVDIVNEALGTEIKQKSKFKMVQIRLKEFLAPVYYKLRKLFGG